MVALKHKSSEKLPEEGLQYVVWPKEKMEIITYTLQNSMRNLKLIHAANQVSLSKERTKPLQGAQFPRQPFTVAPIHRYHYYISTTVLF